MGGEGKPVLVGSNDRGLRFIKRKIILVIKRENFVGLDDIIIYKLKSNGCTEV
jgi:hypothetical protein